MAKASSLFLNASGTRDSDSARLTIMHVAAPGEVGGLESVLLALAGGHQRNGHRVCVVAVVEPDRYPASFLAATQESGAELSVLSVEGRAYRKERRLFREVCRQVKPDVVHTHGFRADVVDAPVARSLSIPIVTTLHGSSRLGGVTHLYEWLELFALRRFDAVIAVSRPLAASLAGRWVAPQHLHFIPNAWAGINGYLDRSAARQTLGLPESGTIIGWVGRLIPVKAAELLLTAVAQIRDRWSFRVCIVGDGPDRTQLQACAGALGLTDMVVFRGSVPGMAKLFPAFDLFVMTSTSEGTPMVLFEAIAAGVPVVATRVGGIPDVITEREGLLVDSGDDKGMAAAIAMSFADPDAAARRAQAARQRLETVHSHEKWLHRHEELYRSILRLRHTTA
jgi:glycosyltransferase involved in cell wall biosynthesis